jgi:protein-disulfide isomerase/uncharacterized membrane protein
MKNKSIVVAIALFFICVGIGVQIYLTSHHYDLMYGQLDAKSFCSVNATVDCDSVNTSSYSEIFGLPIALLSAFVLFICGLLVLGYQIFSAGEKQKMARFLFYITSAHLAASLVMGIISVIVLKVYCLMCMSIWLVSIILFFCALTLVSSKNLKTFKQDFSNLLQSSERGGSRGLLVLFLLVPVGAFLVNGMWKQTISGDQDKLVENSIADWLAARKVDFSIDKGPQLGNPNAIMQIVEFSDFQCPHCKHAAPSIHAFVNSHRDSVHFTFQNYPLDPACNKEMKSGGHDQACRFAKAVLCGDRQGHFVETHDWIFAHQDELSETLLPKLVSEVKLNQTQFDSCMASREVEADLDQQLDRGKLAGIEGTPSIFVNGRLLPGGFIIPVLNAALKSLKN